MIHWYQKRKIEVTNFTDQKEITIPPIAYDEIITGFLDVMKLDISKRSNIIHNLFDNNIFKMVDNYIVFIRNTK